MRKEAERRPGCGEEKRERGECEKECQDAHPALTIYQLKDNTLEMVIFATSLPFPGLYVFVVTQNYFLSVMDIPALFSEGHSLHTCESSSCVCHSHFQIVRWLAFLQNGSLSSHFLARDLKGNLKGNETHELNV